MYTENTVSTVNDHEPHQHKRAEAGDATHSSPENTRRRCLI